LELRSTALQLAKVYVCAVRGAAAAASAAASPPPPLMLGQDLSALQEKRNKLALQYSRVVENGSSSSSSSSTSVHEEGRSLKVQIAVLEDEVAAAEAAAAAAADAIPNTTHATTPSRFG
jgi:hypothetical protein